MASGEKLNCEEVVRDVDINVQGMRIVADLHVLYIVGLDVVLGNAWLRTVGNVLTDNESMRYSSLWEGRSRHGQH